MTEEQNQQIEDSLKEISQKLKDTTGKKVD
jgi:hypothetical protein